MTSIFISVASSWSLSLSLSLVPSPHSPLSFFVVDLAALGGAQHFDTHLAAAVVVVVVALACCTSCGACWPGEPLGSIGSFICMEGA